MLVWLTSFGGIVIASITEMFGNRFVSQGQDKGLLVMASTLVPTRTTQRRDSRGVEASTR
jgi:hypothetical protein